SQGYEIRPACLSQAECDSILHSLRNASPSGTRAGIRHLMANSTVATLANDERLISLASSWLASDAIPFRATLFEKSSDTNWLIPWHQDTALPLTYRRDMPGWGPWSDKAGIHYAHAPASALERVIALRVHLDASDVDNGPLRVIPGSHREGVLSDRRVLE